MRLSRAQNGRFFGYVLGSGEPVGAVADLLVSVLNQNVTAWRSGPAAVAIEHTVVAWLAQSIGCSMFGGHLTGGGSSANLMGLAMAREAKWPANENGAVPGGVVYASEEIHMSIPKSVALLGIGRDHLRLIPTDASFRMIPKELEARIVQDKALGKTRWRSWLQPAQSTLARLIPCDRLPRSLTASTPGFTWMGPMGRSPQSQSEKSSTAWNLPTLFLSTLTSGSINLWIVVAFCIARLKLLRTRSAQRRLCSHAQR
jgi:hypothetical protein